MLYFSAVPSGLVKKHVLLNHSGIFSVKGSVELSAVIIIDYPPDPYIYRKGFETMIGKQNNAVCNLFAYAFERFEAFRKLISRKR